MKPLAFATLMALTLTPGVVFADTWYDPSFRQMIKESDVIGLFRVVEGGTFKARLTPLTLYKGKLKGEIWIGGFSNKYGPIDTLAVGETYVLFVTKVKNHKSKYGSSSNFGDQTIAQAAYDASLFVRSQKNGYFVPTPTSGEYPVIDDKVFVDLADINERIDGFPLSDLKLLVEQSSKKDFADRCKDQIKNNLSGDNPYLLTNYLSALELTGENSYDRIFQEVAVNPSWQTRFTLAKLLGNVKGLESRNLLVNMMNDSVGVVQGEAVRQLTKRESASFLGPLLIKRLDSASNKGLYPSLMSAERNTHESGKIEIIETLGRLNYKPAIPYLLPFLKTQDDYIFKRTLDALMKLGSKEYIAILNERLADPELSASVLFDLTRTIEDQNLTQCKDGLLLQLSRHDRSDNRDKTIILSTLVTLAEQDSSIERSILSDFTHFFTYYDTLQSFNQLKWLDAYIEACTRLRSEKARLLVYRAVYEWNGLNPALDINSEAFDEKRKKEDSLSNSFATMLEAKGYKLKKSIFFSNEFPENQFLISVKLPDDSASFKRRKFIADALSLEEDRIFLVADEGWCWLDCQERFQDTQINSPIRNFIEYAGTLPSVNDLEFLKSLKASDRWEAKYFERELSKTIKQVETVLWNRKN
jgi:hypothetical protein